MQRGEGAPAYYLFDLLELERRAADRAAAGGTSRTAVELLVEGNPLVRLSAGFDDGPALLDAVKAQDLEGVVGQAAGHRSTGRAGAAPTG